MAKRTSYLTKLDQISVGERKLEKKREEGGERSSTFSLDFPVIGPSVFVEARRKVFYTTRASHGYENTRFSPNSKRYGFSLTWFNSCLRDIQMVEIIGPGTTLRSVLNIWD